MKGPALWERRLDESAKAFAAFQVYRDLPPTERSLRRVMDLVAKSYQTIAHWSKRYDWVDRVDAWDGELDRVLRERSIKEREASAKRQAVAGMVMQAKALSKLRTYVDRFDIDGAPVTLKDGQRYTDQMSVSEALRMMIDGARLEAMGRGLPRLPQRPTIDLTTVEHRAVAPPDESPPLTGKAAKVMDELHQLLKMGKYATEDGTQDLTEA